MVFRRRRLQAPIVTDKHEIVWSNLATDISTVLTVVLARGKKLADVNASTEVPLGSKVFGIFIEFNIGAEDITSPKILHWKVFANPVGQTATVPSLYYQTDRAYILKRGMEMLPKAVSTVYKRIIFVRIPKVYQRMKDEMDINISFIMTSAELVNLCGFAIYKNWQ